MKLLLWIVKNNDSRIKQNTLHIDVYVYVVEVHMAS